MKLMIKQYILYLSFFIFFSHDVLAQEDEFVVDQNTGSIRKAVLEFENLDLSVDSFEQVKSCLSIKISFTFHNVTLSDALKQITNSTHVIFVYDDQLLNIPGITMSADSEPLHSVLTKLLEPHDISYFEYETGKIALAKTKKINEKTGGIRGVVKDESGDIIIGANIMLRELKIGCASDLKGNYSIKNIRPGEYVLQISCVGYEKYTRKILIREGQILEINVILKTTAFQIGGIEVIGSTDLLPNEVTTKTTITSGEIEHFQASSIKDVLDLVPGVQKSDNPGLGKTSQIALRGDEADMLSAFGTLIIIDGTPVSNNANLQFESLTGSKFGSSSMGRGVDLRTIPADNIDNLEVITGLPSVRYGDVTSGVINVQSKIGATPNRLKIKNNPDTREGNFGGGIVLGDGSRKGYSCYRR